MARAKLTLSQRRNRSWILQRSAACSDCLPVESEPTHNPPQKHWICLGKKKQLPEKENVSRCYSFSCLLRGFLNWDFFLVGLFFSIVLSHPQIGKNTSTNKCILNHRIFFFQYFFQNTENLRPVILQGLYRQS